MSLTDIIDKVYRQPFPNRWLASLSPFIRRNLSHEAVRAMAMDSFTAFFTRNVLGYRRPDLPVGLVGSVAYHYQDLITEVAHSLGLTISTIEQSPIHGLIGLGGLVA